ncbi:MAG: hypothetical protein ABI435_09905 [Pseudolysinimonas sp.]
MMKRVLSHVAFQLIIGAGIGGVLGELVTGDWIYTIVWSTAIPLFILTGTFASSTSRTPTSPTGIGRVPGIVASAASMPVARVAVLNPEPTAVPVVATTMDEQAPEQAEEPVVATVVSGESADAKPVRPTVPWWSRALAIAVILVGVAVTLIPSYRMIGWTASNIAQGRFWDGNDMRTGLHQQEVVDDLAHAAGTYQFVNIYFYDSYVIAEAPTSATSITTDRYVWRYGRIDSREPESASIDDAFDASQIDFSIVGRLVERSKQDAGWDSFESFYPSVRKSSDGVVEIDVNLSSAYFNATYSYTTSGELIDRSGTGLD